MNNQPLNELDMNLDEMGYALLNRSELIEADYEEKISVDETTGVRALLPGLNFVQLGQVQIMII